MDKAEARLDLGREARIVIFDRLEQAVCSHDIRIEECVSASDRSIDMALRGQMENRRRPVALKNRIQGSTITDVRLLEGISAILRHEI